MLKFKAAYFRPEATKVTIGQRQKKLAGTQKPKDMVTLGMNWKET